MLESCLLIFWLALLVCLAVPPCGLCLSLCFCFGASCCYVRFACLSSVCLTFSLSFMSSLFEAALQMSSGSTFSSSPFFSSPVSCDSPFFLFLFYFFLCFFLDTLGSSSKNRQLHSESHVLILFYHTPIQPRCKDTC